MNGRNCNKNYIYAETNSFSFVIFAQVPWFYLLLDYISFVTKLNPVQIQKLENGAYCYHYNLEPTKIVGLLLN